MCASAALSRFMSVSLGAFLAPFRGVGFLFLPQRNSCSHRYRLSGHRLSNLDGFRPMHPA